MQSTPWGPRPDSWQIVPWASFATPAGEPIVVEPDSDLKQVTVRVRHRGIVERRVSKNKKRVIGTPNQKQIRAGQFIISRIDARNGACGFVPKDLDGAIVTSSFRVFDLDSSVVDSKYFDYMVGMPIFWKLCESISDGSTNRVCLDMDLFDFFIFPLPPLSEQKKVSKILLSLDEAIKQIKNVITKTEQLRDVLRYKLLNRGLPGYHKVWKEVHGIGTTPASWQVIRLGHIANVEFSSVDKKTVDGEIPVVLCNYHDVVGNHRIRSGIDFMPATATAKEIDKWTLQQDDVIFTKDAEIGKVSLVEENIPNLVCGYHLGRARPKQDIVFGPFLAEALKTPVTQKQITRLQTGLTISGIRLGDMRSVQLLLPPFEEQKHIASVLGGVDEAIETIENVIAKTEQLRDALLHNLLTRGLPDNHND